MIYFLIGFGVAFFLLLLFILAFGYGLSGKSPLLLIPFQILLVGSFYEKMRMLFWFAIIVLVCYIGYNHLNININIK